MELDSWVVAASLAVLTASLVQGTTGFGFGIVALPSLALVVPDRLPQILIILGLIISIWVIVRDHAAIEWRVASWLVPSRALGVVPGAALVAALSDRTLDIAFGVVGLLAVLSLLAPRRKQESTRLELAGAGLVAGAMGTSTGLGGPPSYWGQSPALSFSAEACSTRELTAIATDCCQPANSCASRRLASASVRHRGCWNRHNASRLPVRRPLAPS